MELGGGTRLLRPQDIATRSRLHLGQIALVHWMLATTSSIGYTVPQEAGAPVVRYPILALEKLLRES